MKQDVAMPMVKGSWKILFILIRIGLLDVLIAIRSRAAESGGHLVTVLSSVQPKIRNALKSKSISKLVLKLAPTMIGRTPIKPVNTSLTLKNSVN